MVYNNLLSLPVLLGGSLLLEDWSSASLERNFPAEGRMLLLAGIAVSGAAAVGISFTTAWCVRVTGSTTYSMVSLASYWSATVI
jgi:GDP-mannose transporter